MSNLPAVKSVWGVVDDIKTWIRIDRGDDAYIVGRAFNGQNHYVHPINWPPLDFVDVKAIVSGGVDALAKLEFLRSKGLTVGAMQDGREPYLAYVIQPGSELCDLETVNKLVDAEIRADKAIELLKRCYNAGHREGWQDGESNAECFAAVNDFLSNTLGNDWGDKNELSDLAAELPVDEMTESERGDLATTVSQQYESGKSSQLESALRELHAAIERGGLDLSCCMDCGAPVVCIPDGLPMCGACATKAIESGKGLPELTDSERATMNAMPASLVEKLWNKVVVPAIANTASVDTPPTAKQIADSLAEHFTATGQMGGSN